MIGPAHRAHLAEALRRLLGAPSEGAVAYVRDLPSAQVDALADAEDFTVPGWTVAAVIDRPGPRRITADQAVEQREDKGAAALLLIDPQRAGAGLDGIYSAGRELTERALFDEALGLARARMRGRTPFLDAAVRRAERLGRRRRLTPWQKFDFTVAAAEEGEGRAVARLGLWPIRREGAPDDAELDDSAAMADRLLYAQDARSVGERVRALSLEGAAERAPTLERALRGLAGRSPEEAAAAIVDDPDLWLGPMRPGFGGDRLRGLWLAPWRDARGGLLKWSGLSAPAEDGAAPRLVLDPAATSKDRARLTVRWAAEPDTLAAGAVEYLARVVSGEDELAAVTVPHRAKPQQQAVFDLEHFEELEGTERFEAVVELSAVGAEDVPSAQSDAFTIEFGQVSGALATGSGREVRTLVEGAIGLATRVLFDEAVAGAAAVGRASEDRKGFIAWKGGAGRDVRVFRPALLKRVEEDWATRAGAPGRWLQSVRADGSPVGAITFIPLGEGDPALDRARDAGRRLSADAGPAGLLSRVLGGKWPAADAYVAAWERALESADPTLALHGTVEVRTQGGRPLGLLVMPIHPLRFAWQALYDAAVTNTRYEGGLTAAAAVAAAKPLDGARYPFALPGPGVGAPGFVFSDMLGFHVAAMTVDGEREPKAAVAALSACLGGGARAGSTSVGDGAAEVLAREIRYYLECHGGGDGRRPERLDLQAWRPGDGLTVARALGRVLEGETGVAGDDAASSPLCFTLDVYHPRGSGVSGQFLTSAGRRRRSGGQALDSADRWMTETAPRPGGVVVPRLRWAKRPEPEDGDEAAWGSVRPAHVGIAFDLFETRLEVRPLDRLGEARPLHVFGLARDAERRVDGGEEPSWTSWAPSETTGETAPDNRTGGDRLRRLDRAVARATARFLGGGAGDWPVLVTRLPAADRRRLDRLHACNDWVITADRNAGLEYFDAPRERNDVYERFVIDAVPERGDLSALRLVTSTTDLDAVRDLVDEALGEMGLSSSGRNSRFLVEQLKSLSGRLAIRLANGGTRTAELVALALAHAHCATGSSAAGPWLDLRGGVLVPVDEIADFAPIATADDGDEGTRRADFIHVAAPGRGPLEFRFVEVKHRRHLRNARQPELLAQMAGQTAELRRRWMRWFFEEPKAPLERAVRRSQLARLLRFYVERAGRHRLEPAARDRLLKEVDQLVLKDGYVPAEVDAPDVGYVFCPEHRGGGTEPLYGAGAGGAKLWLFGPTMLPDELSRDPGPPPSEFAPAPEAMRAAAVAGSPLTEAPEAPLVGGTTSLTLADSVDVLLGETPGGAPVEWRVSARTNPHLMTVGLPGMGKTTALINICRQFAAAGVAPVVFSYHDDIDAKLADVLGPMQTIDFAGLGFNPLRVEAEGTTAHIDVAGTLRDIFASIFPDLGDVQLEELRQATKQSYDDVGWGAGAQADRSTPAFRAFFDILRAKPKPNANLLARLQELADYGFFDGAEEDTEAGLLNDGRPTLVRMHLSTNGMLQNAFAAFVLYSLYKEMFRRGVQPRLTHAVIFDEAHRAAKLKLIPRFAKECRKFGLSLTLASQGVRDFDGALFEAVGSYLVLRVTDSDARTLARNSGIADDQARTADRFKVLAPYHAVFLSGGSNRPVTVKLLD